MTKVALLAVFLLGVAALAGGVLHLVAVDARGDVVFAPRIDSRALSWWSERAETVVERASTMDDAASTDLR